MPSRNATDTTGHKRTGLEVETVPKATGMQRQRDRNPHDMGVVMQHADAKFERRDPFPKIPFASDEADSLPTLTEALGWIVLGGSFMALCVGFLGIA